jgi:RNA polymerase sigma factor (sigma-70 family)
MHYDPARLGGEKVMERRVDIESALPVVEDILHLIRSKKRLTVEEWEDFRSWAWLKLVESDYAAIHKFDGRGTLRAYLSVVLSRFLLDYRAQKWGKWRPSAKARELGPVAVNLERLIKQKGYSVSDAVQALVIGAHCPVGVEELHELAALLPLRRRDSTTSEDWIENVPCFRSSPEGELLAQEAEEARSRLGDALLRSLSQLGTEERLAIKLRFEQGLKLQEVARALGRDPRRFYRQFERILNRLARLMKRNGVEKGQLQVMFPEGTASGENPT